MRSYRFESCQATSCFGSFCGRLAFIGKSVFGRLRVFFSSSGSAMERWIGSLLSRHFLRMPSVLGGETSETHVITYVTMKGVQAVSRYRCNLSGSARIVTETATEAGTLASIGAGVS